MKRTLAFGGVVATTAGLLAATLAAPAQADNDVASDALANTGISAWATLAYWYGNKGANLIAATPYNIETKVVAKHVSTEWARPDSKPGVVPAIGDEKKTTSTSKNINLPKTVGKVFFNVPDGLGTDPRTGKANVKDGLPDKRWCTATSVQSAYRNLVATAGHCVYDTETNASIFDNWVFVPGYYQGKTPWGIYVGKQAFTHYDFDVYEDYDRDYAFVTVYNGLAMPHDGVVRPFDENPGSWKEVSWNTYKQFPKIWHEFRYKKQHGNTAVADTVKVEDYNEEQKKCYKYYVWAFVDAGRLGDNVGGQGIAYNQKIGGNVFVFGYPSGSHPDGNYAYTGITQKWSYGKTFKAQALGIKAEELVGVKSSFTGAGSGGSPWLMTYKNSRRLGFLNGVTSKVSDTDGNNRIDVSVSPYFDGELFGVYSAARNLWSGSIAVPYEVPSGYDWNKHHVD